MKITNLHSLLIWLSICIISCEKPNNAVADPNNIPGLPPATQSGANTFGCLVNGVPWVPAGSNGTSNLSIDYDPVINNGIFSIVAYRFNLSSNDQMIMGIRNGLNSLNSQSELTLSSNSLYSISFNERCHWFNQFTDVSSNGTLTLKKFDRANRIIAGEFNAKMFKAGCDTIKITNGRFDFKF